MGEGWAQMSGAVSIGTEGRPARRCRIEWHVTSLAIPTRLPPDGLAKPGDTVQARFSGVNVLVAFRAALFRPGNLASVRQNRLTNPGKLGP